MVSKRSLFIIIFYVINYLKNIKINLFSKITLNIDFYNTVFLNYNIEKPKPLENSYKQI